MKAIQLIVAVFVIAFITSCDGPRSYIKTNPFISFTDSVGHSEVAGTMGFNRAEGIISYSPLYRLDLRALGYGGSLGSAYEFSLGLYQRTDIVRLACYGGIGRADLKQTKRNGQTHGSGDDDPLQHVYGRFNEIFVQPELGFYVSPQARLGYSVRISFVEYDHLRYSQTSYSGTSPRPEYTLYEGKPKGTVFEYQVYFRHSLKRQFFTLQIGFASDDFPDEYPTYNPVIASLSYGFTIIPRERNLFKI